MTKKKSGRRSAFRYCARFPDEKKKAVIIHARVQVLSLVLRGTLGIMYLGALSALDAHVG